MTGFHFMIPEKKMQAQPENIVEENKLHDDFLLMAGHQNGVIWI